MLDRRNGDLLITVLVVRRYALLDLILRQGLGHGGPCTVLHGRTHRDESIRSWGWVMDHYLLSDWGLGILHLFVGRLILFNPLPELFEVLGSHSWRRSHELLSGLTCLHG